MESPDALLPEPPIGRMLHEQLGRVVPTPPYLLVMKIPRCPACHAANPQALSHCPECGGEALPPEGFQHIESGERSPGLVIPVSRTARFCFRAAEFLTKLSQRIEKD